LGGELYGLLLPFSGQVAVGGSIVLGTIAFALGTLAAVSVIGHISASMDI
jgi:hypothetical protein